MATLRYHKLTEPRLTLLHTASVRPCVRIKIKYKMFFPLLLLTIVFTVCECDKPHIVLIIADDLGWNDVGFHGMNQIPTPNIDALAWSGVMLHNYYVTPICTPSRAALMTGKYPIHTGMQHGVIYGSEPRGLPLSEKILPQYLKDLQYKTHLVGKWHLGSYKKDYLPLNRGFDSHLGFWAGKIDMYDHINEERGYWGFDFRRNMSVAYDLYGKYATDVYTQEAIRIINDHKKEDPLFLMIAHSAVHSGSACEPIRAPDNVVANFTYITDYQRQKFAGVLTKLDESVGDVVAALQTKQMLENSIIIFTTDNGGPAEGFNDNRASNFPLRGVKNTLWEGGVRGAGLIWSPLIEKKSRIGKQRLHLIDWMPTLLSAAGMNVSTIKDIDGIDQWNALSKDLKSERNTILHNIDDEIGNAAITIGKWKLHKGTSYGGRWDGWYGPGARAGRYDARAPAAGAAGRALARLALMPDSDNILELRKKATIKCNRFIKTACRPLLAPCLFDIEDDPCETNNLAEKEPEKLRYMLQELEKINKTAIKPNNEPLDPRGDPKFWGHVITNFGDYENTFTQTY